MYFSFESSLTLYFEVVASSTPRTFFTKGRASMFSKFMFRTTEFTFAEMCIDFWFGLLLSLCMFSSTQPTVIRLCLLLTNSIDRMPTFLVLDSSAALHILTHVASVSSVSLSNLSLSV